jgi:hypothetical protein
LVSLIGLYALLSETRQDSEKALARNLWWKIPASRKLGMSPQILPGFNRLTSSRYGEPGLRNSLSRSRPEYREHLGRRLGEVYGDEEEWKKIRRGWLLGSEGFVERMKEKLLDGQLGFESVGTSSYGPWHE